MIHLFLHQQFSFMGHLHLNMVGSDHQVRPTIDWCPNIRHTVDNENLRWYINDFLPVLYTLLHDGPLPRVIPEMIQELKSTPLLATGDWFLYEDHTIIRVYGFGGRPFKLPTFLTPRNFALEIIRQKMASDDQHFSDRKATRTFRIATELGPFIVRSRQASKIVEKRLNKMKFPTVGAWTYDPKGIILRLKDPVGKRSAAENPYHEPQPLIERLANKVSFLQTKVSLATAEQSLVVREKQPGGDLSEEMPTEKRSKTEEDLEHMMQIITGSQRKEYRGELFSFQGPEEASKEAEARGGDTPGV